jgi:hypothetical protein
MDVFSVGLSLYPSIVAGQQLGEDVPAERRSVGDVVFHAVHIVSKEMSD